MQRILILTFSARPPEFLDCDAAALSHTCSVRGGGGIVCFWSFLFCFFVLAYQCVCGGGGDKHNRHLQLWRDKAITLSALLVLYPYPNSHSISSLERLRTKKSS